ncbi:MAG: GNAT family N-acetyltransferase [Myxococcales bacterium]
MTTSEGLHALEPEWKALAERCGEGLPFHTWEWADAWWRCFREDSFAVRDRLALRAVRTAQSGELVAVAPLMEVHRPGLGLPAFRGLEFLGADPNVTEVSGVLADPRFLAQAYEALGEHLLERADEWDWVAWRGVPDDGAALNRCGEWGSTLPGRLMGYRLRLEGTWEQFRASRPRNLKESLRKCANSLRRDGLRAELEALRRPADVAAGLGHFLGLHRARAQAKDLAPHPDVFCDPASRAFLREACASLASRDAVRLFQLRIGGEVVAARLAFVVGSTLYLYFSGFDPAWARYSVASSVTAGAVQHAFSERLAFVHLSTGTDPSKLRWRPEPVCWRAGLQLSPRASSGAKRAVLELLLGERTEPLRKLIGHVLGRKRSAPSQIEAA